MGGRDTPFTTERAAPWGRHVLRWLGATSVAIAVIAWLALVLHYQYQVAWLGDYIVAEDALFLLGVAGITLTRSVERWGAARLRPVALRLAFSIAIAAGALAVAEFGARLVFRRTLSTVAPRVSLNALGYRDREFGPKNPNRYRIAVMGDSFTYGDGIEEPDRFSNLIQGLLGPQYEVLNFGHAGDNMPEHLKRLDQVLSLSPDFVLLQLYENDFETPDMTRNRPRAYPLLPSDLDTRIEQPSLLYRLLIGRWNQFQEAIGLEESYTHYMARHLRDPDSSDAREAFGMLSQFIERTRVAGVPMGGVLFPALYGLGQKGANYPFDYMNDRIRMIYTVEQTPYLDLLPAFLTIRDPRSLWVSPFDAHPNAKANKLAAIAIQNKFEPVWHR
jgi:GDSL-like lipase/acylhydrolase family protein